MAWPTTAVVTGDTITAANLNLITTKILEQEIVGENVPTIQVTGIPSHFRHLLLRITGRGNLASSSAVLRMRLNGDVAGNYHRQYVAQNSGTDAGSELFSQTSADIGYVAAANALPPAPNVAGSWAQVEILIPNYSSTSMLKHWMSRAHHIETLASAHAGLWVGYWDNTAAVNAIDLLLSGGDFVQNTNVQLFGMP